MDQILVQLDAEIAQLQQARSLIAGVISNRNRTAAPTSSVKPKKKMVLSPAARQRIRDAQKRRWAAVKKKSKAAK